VKGRRVAARLVSISVSMAEGGEPPSHVAQLRAKIKQALLFEKRSKNLFYFMYFKLGSVPALSTASVTTSVGT
jgi:hypothetical protein